MTNCYRTPVGARLRRSCTITKIGSKMGGYFNALPFPPLYYVTSARCFARRCDSSAGATRAAKGVGRRRRSINIKLSVQHLPTSVATRVTTRPARCSRIDFANTTWKTAACFSVCQQISSRL